MKRRDSQLDIYLPLLLKRAEQRRTEKTEPGKKTSGRLPASLLLATLFLAGILSFARQSA